MERLRVAVIGCGKVAQNLHLPALAKSSRCQLVAVCDSSQAVAAAVGRRYSVANVYEDLDAVLSDPDVDAVLIAVGDPDHVAVAAQALRAGVHVLVEKPLGMSVAECGPLRELVAGTALKLQVAVMKRHDPGLEYAARAVGEQIGALVSFSCWYRAAADEYLDEASVFLPVARDPQYSRPAYKRNPEAYYLATHGAHLFDGLRYVLGPVTSARALLSTVGERHSWHGLAELEGGRVGNFELTVYIEGDWSEGFVVFGERGSVSLSFPNPFFQRAAHVRIFEAASRTWREPSFDEGDSYLRQLDAFAASVLDGAEIRADIDDGIATLELIEAVAASAATDGSPVRLAR